MGIRNRNKLKMPAKYLVPFTAALVSMASAYSMTTELDAYNFVEADAELLNIEMFLAQLEKRGKGGKGKKEFDPAKCLAKNEKRNTKKVAACAESDDERDCLADVEAWKTAMDAMCAVEDNCERKVDKKVACWTLDCRNSEDEDACLSDVAEWEAEQDAICAMTCEEY